MSNDLLPPTPRACRVTFMGLGTMGAPMASHLQRAGHQLTVYNRSPAKAQDWAQRHMAACKGTARDAVEGADIVVSCVGRDDDVRSLVESTVDALSPGTIWVDHTTTSAALARDMAKLCQAHGVAFVDAPVSGGNVGAEQGTLSVMCGGDTAAVERIKPVLAAYAKAVVHMGDSGAGQLTKMVNQICVAGVLQGLAEGLAFGEQAGLDMAKVLQAVSQGAASSWQMVNRGPTMLARKFDMGFTVDWMRKDLGLCLAQAQTQGSELPMTQVIDQHYAEIQTMGGGRWDTSSLMVRLNKPSS